MAKPPIIKPIGNATISKGTGNAVHSPGIITNPFDALKDLFKEEIDYSKGNIFYSWPTGYPPNEVVDLYKSYIRANCFRSNFTTNSPLGKKIQQVYKFSGNQKLPFKYNKDFHKKVICYLSINESKRNKVEKDFQDYEDQDYFLYDGEEDLSETENNMINDAIRKFKDDGEIISVLEESNKLYSDIAKIQEKYCIRLADDKFAVASDQIITTLRDPSSEPAWISWFLAAVPIEKTPDPTYLLTLSEEERSRYCPDPIPDSPIICHATLWKLGNDSGILYSTAWNHLSVNYRIKIKKPIEIASMMFRTVSHPAHLIRNFSLSPKASIPGNDWF